MEKKRILVVEDEKIVAADIQRRLEILGYSVVGASSSGEEAIALTEKTHPDLILMDIILKGKMNGIEAAEQIQRRFNIPVIYLTAHADEATLQIAKVTEPYGYILKPFEARELQTAIEIALHKHKVERELKEQVTTILRSIGDGVITTDKEGLVTFINPIGQTLTGWKYGDVLGKNLAEVLNISNKELGTRVILGESNINSVDSMLIAKNGREMPIEISAAPIRDKAGEITGKVLVFHDISDRKQAEDAIRQSEERFRQMAGNINEVFYLSDLRKPEMIYISPAYEGIWGRTCESLYEDPKSFLEAIHPHDRDCVIVSLKKQFQGEPTQEEYRITRPDGVVRWILDRAFPIREESGEVFRIAGIAEDITDRVRVEEKLRKSEKLSAIGQIAAGIAHEIRNPLSAIATAVHVLEKRTKNDEDNILFKAIKNETERLQDITTDFLKFARPYTPKLSLENINLVLEETISLLENDPNSHGVDFEKGLDKTIPNFLFDRDQIRQVVWNLALNGLQTMTDGGRLRIRLANIGDHLEIEVMDSGKGITDADLENIFEPFYTTKNEGTGLGLPIAAKIVAAHGGSIDVDSEVGQGTKFTLSLPIKDRTEERNGRETLHISC